MSVAEQAPLCAEDDALAAPTRSQGYRLYDLDAPRAAREPIIYDFDAELQVAVPLQEPRSRRLTKPLLVFSTLLLGALGVLAVAKPLGHAVGALQPRALDKEKSALKKAHEEAAVAEEDETEAEVAEKAEEEAAAAAKKADEKEVAAKKAAQEAMAAAKTAEKKAAAAEADARLPTECNEGSPTFQKIKRIAFNFTSRTDEDIHKGKHGKAVMEDIENTLNTLGVAAVSSNGVLVTASDMDVLAHCELGISGHIEEHTSTGSGVELNQGDMASRADLGDPISNNDSQDGNSSARRLWASRWAGFTWDKGHVKYCYAPDISRQAKEAFKLAVKHVSDQVPCLTFDEVADEPVEGQQQSEQTEEGWVPWFMCLFGSCAKPPLGSGNCVEAPSVYVQSIPDDGCWSFVGQISGKYTNFVGKSQPLNLGSGCETIGVAAHELGHALAMEHEQARTDRDEYVTVYKENIKDGYEINFDVNRGAYTGAKYDVFSLMHYSATAFSKDGSVTIEPKNSLYESVLGQRMGFSELDIDHIGDMYGCQDSVTPTMLNKDILEQLGV